MKYKKPFCCLLHSQALLDDIDKNDIALGRLWLPAESGERVLPLDWCNLTTSHDMLLLLLLSSSSSSHPLFHDGKCLPNLCIRGAPLQRPCCNDYGWSTGSYLVLSCGPRSPPLFAASWPRHTATQKGINCWHLQTSKVVNKINFSQACKYI